jgi:hypothetical protein
MSPSLIVCAAGLLAASTPPTQLHPREYWEAIAQSEYRVPQDADVGMLLDQLASLVGHADPAWRDGIGFTITERWIRTPGLVPEPVLQRLTDRYLGGLEATTAGPHSSISRSFSALNLASLIWRDNQARFLDDARYTRVFEAGVSYLLSERDLRGYTPSHGWIHALAHTSDLLRRFAQSPRLTPQQQARILDAIAERIASLGPDSLDFGEDDRIVAVVRALTRREDLAAAALEPFFDRLLQLTQYEVGITLDLTQFNRSRQAGEILEGLLASLALDPKPGPAAKQALELLLAKLRR